MEADGGIAGMPARMNLSRLLHPAEVESNILLRVIQTPYRWGWWTERGAPPAAAVSHLAGGKNP